MSKLRALRVSAVKKMRPYHHGGAEDTEETVLIKKGSQLSELGVSAVKKKSDIYPRGCGIRVNSRMKTSTNTRHEHVFSSG